MTTFPTKRGEFNLLRKIGEGGMAEVFLAERGGDEGFKTLVALKRLHGGFALDQYFIRQLVQEAKLLGQLQHNNIVRVHDLRRIEDEYFIVMEYIDGIDLAQAIQVHRDNDLRFPLSIFFHIALSLCEALEFAHSAVDLTGKPIRLIHRDIKPSNVLIHHRGIVKLTDFGIARVGDTSNTGSVVKGTANYMSPEQASGEQNLTPASDIFSLGAVFWEMLTLEKLVEGNNYLNVINSIKELNVGLKDITKKGIEPGLRMILLRMLARKRELRYQNMGLVLKDLRFVAEQMKVDLSPSHLREYMAKITNLAREAAARMYAGQNLAAQDPDAPTPRPAAPPAASAGSGAPPGLKSRSAEVSAEPSPPAPPPGRPAAPPPKRGDAAFAESVAALKKLVQAGPGKAGPPPDGGAAAAPPAPSRPVPRPASPAQLGRDTGGMKQQPPGGSRPPAPPAAPPPVAPPPARGAPPPGPAAALTPSASYVGPGPRQRPPTDAAYAPADAPTAPPRKPEPVRPGQVPPSARAGIDDAAASAPSAAALKSVSEIAEAAGLTGPVVRAAQAPAPPADPAKAGLVRRNTNDPRVRAATAEVAALIAKRTGQQAAHRPGAPPPAEAPPPPPPASAPPPAVAPPAAPPPRSVPPPSARPAGPPPPASAPVPPTRPQPSVAAMPPQPSLSATPPTDSGTWDGYDDDEYDEEDEAYYASTRRANMIVLGVGLAAAVLVFGLIGVLWLLPPSDDPSEGDLVAENVAPVVPVETPAPEPEPEPELADAGFDDPELDAGRTSRGSRADTAPPSRLDTDSWSDRGTTSGSTARTVPSTRSSSGSTSRDSGSRSATGPTSRSSDSGSRPSAGSTSPSSGSSSASRSSGSSSRSSGSSDSGSSWRSSGSGSSSGGSSSAGSSPSRSASSDLRDPYSTPSRDEPEDDWAIAGEGSTAASASSELGEPTTLGGDVMAGMTDKARRGRLSDDEIRRLESIDLSSDEYESSRAVLMAQYEASGDRAAHCETVGEVLRLDRNQANPQFNLEMGKCHLRQGRYQDALQAARVAELNAQDIPARIRTDRQLKIWEIQAKSYKGLYQGTENLDYIDDSIAVWKRYRHLAENTYRQREAERAEGEIRELSELKDGAL